MAREGEKEKERKEEREERRKEGREKGRKRKRVNNVLGSRINTIFAEAEFGLYDVKNTTDSVKTIPGRFLISLTYPTWCRN